MTENDSKTQPLGETIRADVLEGSSAHATLDAFKIRLAMQVAPARWQKPLDRLADAIEKGSPLDEAIQSHQRKMPTELMHLMTESLSVDDPAVFLIDAMKMRQEVRRSWRELSRVCIYPMGLFMFALLVGVAFSYTMRYVVDTQWIEELQLTGIENMQQALADQHNAILGVAIISAWIGLVLLTIYFVGPPWAWLAVLGGTILIGKPLRWLTMQEILARYSLFLEQGVPLGEASLAVSRSFASSSQAVVSKAIANRIQQGMPLGKALSGSMLSDGICRPALFLMDDKEDALPEAIKQNVDFLGRMVDRRCQTLASLVPVFLLLAVGTIIWSAIVSYILAIIPLVQMMQLLA